MQFGSGGPASIGHIYGELMMRAMGVKMTHVPYRGGAPMTTDLIAGQIPIGIDVVTAFVPYFKSGQMQAAGRDLGAALAAGAGRAHRRRERLPQARARQLLRPDRPEGMPADVVARLNGALNEVLKQPDIVKRLVDSASPRRPARRPPSRPSCATRSPPCNRSSRASA